MDVGKRMVLLVLQPWLDQLLLALQAIVVQAWQGPGGTAAGGEKGGRVEASVTSPRTALLLGDALASLISGAAGPVGRRGARSHLDETGLARALGALAALWSKLAAQGGLGSVSQERDSASMGGDTMPSVLPACGVQESSVWRYWDTLSGLTLRLHKRDARTALVNAFAAAATLLPA
ncbi:uncharacterized protein HaLaN_20930, partial [Haematococcus lacustris]